MPLLQYLQVGCFPRHLRKLQTQLPSYRLLAEVILLALRQVQRLLDKSVRHLNKYPLGGLVQSEFLINEGVSDEFL